jgi:hypothetical protein
MHKKSMPEMSCKAANMAKGMMGKKKKKHDSMKHSKEDLHEAHKHMKKHGG